MKWFSPIIGGEISLGYVINDHVTKIIYCSYCGKHVDYQEIRTEVGPAIACQKCMPWIPKKKDEKEEENGLDKA